MYCSEQAEKSTSIKSPHFSLQFHKSVAPRKTEKPLNLTAKMSPHPSLHFSDSSTHLAFALNMNLLHQFPRVLSQWELESIPSNSVESRATLLAVIPHCLEGHGTLCGKRLQLVSGMTTMSIGKCFILREGEKEGRKRGEEGREERKEEGKERW